MDFELLLFTTHVPTITAAVAAGVQGIIVDWEHLGKQARQAGADTQVNHDTLADLRRVRRATGARVITRVNRFGATTMEEIEAAIDGGADELLLPMVESVAEVEQALDLVRGRIGVGILIETVAATHLAEELCRLPLARTYVGLNDLAIDRRSPSIFTAVADRTVERLRETCPGRFGFGGLTLPELGQPIPCRLLIGEMARLHCHFSFLRRSFHRDLQGRSAALEVPRILHAIAAARRRSAAAVAREQLELDRAIRACDAAHQVSEATTHAELAAHPHADHRRGRIHRR